MSLTHHSFWNCRNLWEIACNTPPCHLTDTWLILKLLRSGLQHTTTSPHWHMTHSETAEIWPATHHYITSLTHDSFWNCWDLACNTPLHHLTDTWLILKLLRSGLQHTTTSPHWHMTHSETAGIWPATHHYITSLTHDSFWNCWDLWEIACNTPPHHLTDTWLILKLLGSVRNSLQHTTSSPHWHMTHSETAGICEK